MLEIKDFITIMILIIIVNLFFNSRREMFSPTEQQTEAIDTISSMYNNKKVTTTSLNVTGNGTIVGNLDVGSLNILPKGIIVAWGSDIIPAGWALCDGKNGTPNLIDRFLLGSGKQKLLTTGGEETHKLTVDELPSHDHAGIPGTHCEGHHCAAYGGGEWANLKNSALAGGDKPHNNMPPYTAVNFIMKL